MPDDAPFDIRSPQYETPLVAKIIGVEQQVLLGWRRRHGFLGGAVEGKQGRDGYRHSLMQVMVAAAVAEMIVRGLDPANAIMAEPELEFGIEDLLTNKNASPIFGFHAKGRDPKIKASFYFLRRNDKLGAVLDATPTGSIQLVNLQWVIERVLSELGVKIERPKS